MKPGAYRTVAEAASAADMTWSVETLPGRGLVEATFFKGKPRPFQQKAATAVDLVRKSSPFEVKDLDERKGLVTAAVNTLGVKDLQNDIVDRGAWAGVLGQMQTGKTAWPTVLWGHDWAIPVGRVTQAWESPGLGQLMATMKFNLETQRGREAFSDVRQKLISQWSVGFMPADDGHGYDERGVHHVSKVAIWPEVSAVLVGASPGTRTLETKSAALPDYLTAKSRPSWVREDDVDEELVMRLLQQKLAAQQRDDALPLAPERFVDPDAPRPPYNPARLALETAFENPVNEDSLAAFLARLASGQIRGPIKR